MFQFCRNHLVCDHWSITVHAFIHQTFMATSWQKTKQKWYHLAVHLHTSVQKDLELPYHAHVWHVLYIWHSKWPYPEMASCWTLSKHPPCSHILHAVHQATPTQRYLNPIHFQWSAHEHTYLLQGRLTTHAFSTPTKVTEFGHTPSCCNCQNSSSVFCPCLHFTCHNIKAFQVTTSQSDGCCWTLSKHPQCSHILLTCLPTYSPQR